MYCEDISDADNALFHTLTSSALPVKKPLREREFAPTLRGCVPALSGDAPLVEADATELPSMYNLSIISILYYFTSILEKWL